MILLLLPALILSSVSCHPIGHEIKVDQATGTDNSSCLLGGNPCATVNKALEGFKMNYSSTTIYVSPGNYTLEHGEVNNITDKDHIAIIGSGETNTIINCKPFAGLYISNCNSTNIKSVFLVACGYNSNIAYDIWVLRLSYKFKLANSAIFFNHCTQIAIDFVTIQFSNGTGLLLYNSNGPITVNNSLIADGYGELPMISSPDRFVVGGGIVVISDDGDYHCFNDFNIANSKILNNIYNLTHVNGYQPDCVSLSGGAALTLINTCYSSVHVDSCTIANNSRGFFIYSDFLFYETLEYQFENVTLLNMQDNINVVNRPKYTSTEPVALTFVNVNMSEYLLFMYDKTFPHVTSVESRNSFILLRFQYFESICSFETTNVNFGPGYCNSSDGFAACPISYSMCTYDQSNIINCSCFDNHAGPYCGQCIEGHSVAINSPYLACVPCNDTMTVLKGWGLLIVLEFIPVTVMVAVIAVLNVNLNQGLLKAYIFFCQILTIPFPSVSYPSWFVVGYNFDHRVIDLAFLPFSIWNLGFINYPSCNLFDGSNHCNSMSICISPNTTPLGAIAFQYIIGFYPFLLLSLSYACITMYDKGCKCIVCVVRPVPHRVLARFWGMFNIQPSLPHIIASVYTLSFTQLAATSLKLLHFTTYENQLHFFYDGSQRYFSGWHGAAGTLALIVLIVFIIVPTVYLSLYPFKLFQVVFNKLHFKKDMLISITDVFTGPYKDGTDNNSWDYQYFTGLHFLLKLLIMCLYCLPYGFQSFATYGNSVLCVLSITILLLFRPYKRNIHTFVEILLFICFAVFSVSSTSFQIYYLINFFTGNDINAIHIGLLLRFLIKGFICLMYVLLLFVCCYCLFWFLKKSKTGIMYIYQLHSRPTASVNTQTHSVSEQHLDNFANDDMFVDHLLNPQATWSE